MLNFHIYLHLLLSSQFTEGRDETGHSKGSQDRWEIASAEKTSGMRGSAVWFWVVFFALCWDSTCLRDPWSSWKFCSMKQSGIESCHQGVASGIGSYICFEIQEYSENIERETRIQQKLQILIGVGRSHWWGRAWDSGQDFEWTFGSNSPGFYGARWPQLISTWL